MPMRRKRLFQLPWRSRAAIARDVDEELAFHLESRVAELTAHGVAPADARRRALHEFGDIDRTRDYCRAVDERDDRALRMTERLAEWNRDARFALRTLWRAPGFSLVSLLTLALAIGANTAVFSVARAVLLAPPPYASPSSLVRLYDASTTDLTERTPFSPANLADYREQQRSLVGIGAYLGNTPTWQPEHGQPEILIAETVTPDLFGLLGVRALHGRTFVPSDSASGLGLTIILSYEFWHRTFGDDSTIVGKRIPLNNRTYEVLGVMPRGFTLGMSEDVWFPLKLSYPLNDSLTARRQHYLNVVARLRQGVTLERARADLATIARRLEAQYPEANTGRTTVIVPLHEALAGDLRPALLLLQAAAVMVLLIACANLTNLGLSRSTGRRREMAVRAALGAGRARIARELLVESAILAIIGGVLGILLAIGATRALLALDARALPPMFDVTIDARVLAFSLALSLATGVLVGLVPAVRTARDDLHESLKAGGRAATAGGDSLRRALVVAQVSLAVVLLVGTGLLVRSLRELTRAQIGFDPSHVLTAQLRASGHGYDSAGTIGRFYGQVISGIASAPGVVAAGAATMLPTRGSVSTTLRIEGEPVDERNLPEVGFVAVRGGYFEAMRIPLIAGRLFDRTDGPTGPEAVLINQAAARRFFPSGDAIGRRIRIGPNPNGEPMTIVGIVGDIRGEALDIPAKPTLFADYRREDWERSAFIVIRTTGDPNRAAPLVRRSVQRADPTLAVRDVAPLEDVLGASLAPRRFALGLVSAFAAIALMLSAIGIYGVLSYMVASRTREFGVRIALGATTRSVLSLVLRQGVAWSLAGVGLGLAGTVAGGRLLAGMLYGVRPVDATTYAVVVIGLLAVVIAACAIPAVRATRADPVESMRGE